MNKIIKKTVIPGLVIAFLLLLATNFLNSIGNSLFDSAFQKENLQTYKDISLILRLLGLGLIVPFIWMTFRIEAKKCIKYIITAYACLTAFLGLVAFPIQAMLYQTGVENLASAGEPIALIFRHWPVSLCFVVNQFMNPIFAMFLVWAFFNQQSKLSEAIWYYVPLSVFIVIVEKVLGITTPIIDGFFTSELYHLIVYMSVCIISTFGALRIFTKSYRDVEYSDDLSADKTKVREVITPLGFISFISFVVIGLLVLNAVPIAEIRPLINAHRTIIELGGIVIAILFSLLATSLLRKKGWKLTARMMTISLFSLIGITQGITFFPITNGENVLIFAKMLEAGAKDAIMLALLQVAIVAFSKENRLKIQSWVLLIIQPVLAYIVIGAYIFTKVVGFEPRIAVILFVIAGCWASLYSIKIIGKQKGLEEQHSIA